MADKVPKDSHTYSLKIGLLGSEGSGKTCFLAALNWLANLPENAPFSLAAADSPTQVVFNELGKAFKEHRLPAPTHRKDDLVFDLRYQGRQYRITTHDIEGEAFKRVGNEMQTDDPIFADLAESDILLVFLDAERDVRNADSDSARIAAIEKLLGRFDMAGTQKRVAVLLTKADEVNGQSSQTTPSDAAGFLKEHLPSLYRQLDSEIHESAVFFLAAIGHGELAEGRDPQPRGFPELLNWIQAGFDAREDRRKRRAGLRIAGMCLVALACAAGLLAMRAERQKKADETIENGTPGEIQANLGQASREKQQQVADDLSRRSCQLIDSTTSWREVEAFYKNEFSPAYEKLPLSLRGDLREAKAQLQERAETLFAEAILKSAEEGNVEDVDKLADQYGKLVEDGTFPGRKGAALTRAKDEAFSKRKRAAMMEIKNIVLGRSDRSSLQKKTMLVESFQYYSPSEKTEAKRATELSRRFQSNVKYKLTAIGVGTLKKRGKLDPLKRTLIRIAVDDNNYETEPVRAETPKWDKTLEFAWELGQAVVVEWCWKEPGLYSVPIARKQIGGSSTSLLEMLTTESLDLSDHLQRPQTAGQNADFWIKCEGFENPAEDFELFQKYIDPGTFWED